MNNKTLFSFLIVLLVITLAEPSFSETLKQPFLEQLRNSPTPGKLYFNYPSITEENIWRIKLDVGRPQHEYLYIAFITPFDKEDFRYRFLITSPLENIYDYHEKTSEAEEAIVIPAQFSINQTGQFPVNIKVYAIYDNQEELYYNYSFTVVVAKEFNSQESSFGIVTRHNGCKYIPDCTGPEEPYYTVFDIRLGFSYYLLFIVIGLVSGAWYYFFKKRKL